jgi:hypothetical protein
LGRARYRALAGFGYRTVYGGIVMGRRAVGDYRTIPITSLLRVIISTFLPEITRFFGFWTCFLLE